MTECRIHINDRAINSIRVPDLIRVEAGHQLSLAIENHGSPVHLTLSSENAHNYTDFFHANLYVESELEYTIPVHQNAMPGSFEISVITGYGAKNSYFKVEVTEPAPEPEPEVEEVLVPKKKNISLPWLSLPLLLVAGLAFGVWKATAYGQAADIAFISLLLGVATTCLYRH